MPPVAAAPAAADQCGRHHAMILRRPGPSSNRITSLFHALALGSGGTLQGLDLLLEGGLLLVRGLQLVPEPCTPAHLLLMASLLRGEETLKALDLAVKRGGLALVGDSSLLGGGDLLRSAATRWTWIRGCYGRGLHLGVDLEVDVDVEEDVLSGEARLTVRWLNRSINRGHHHQRLIGFDADGGWSPSASSKVRFEAQAHDGATRLLLTR
ncbi:hypothetical protein ZEAMMB73_Zm00001d050449 [Zea mays]|uniref:Uncharacterized protein n=1 Tax=Zea mays TaxID=4577 RepID=K7UV74_MAIZE|nr:hypothetical protein ZEAMMB73_Zm00001d050449 [Zea mays]